MSKYTTLAGNPAENIQKYPRRLDDVAGKLATHDKVGTEKAAIDRELELLHEAVQSAHHLMSDLEVAVQPVSMDPPPTDEIGDHQYVGVSRVYNTLHEAVESIYGLHNRIIRARANLEV